MDDVGIVVDQTNLNMCVAAKLLATKRANVKALRSVLRSVWKVYLQTNIDCVGDNLFVIKFTTMKDKLRTLNTRSWTFDNSLIVME